MTLVAYASNERLANFAAPLTHNNRRLVLLYYDSPRSARNRFFPTGLALETLSGERAKTVKGGNFVHYIALGSGRRRRIIHPLIRDKTWQTDGCSPLSRRLSV